MSEEKVHRITLTLEGGYEFRAAFESFPGAPAIVLDEPPPLGEGQAPNATAVLAAAVGNCLGASLLFCLRRSHVTIDRLTVHVSARVTRNERGRLRIAGLDVELLPAVDAADQARLDRCRDLFEDFCVVTGSVRAGIPVNVAVTPPAAT